MTTAIVCVEEQTTTPAIQLLRGTAAVTAQPLAALLTGGWIQPLVLFGDLLSQPDGLALVRRALHSAAPLLILPPLETGDVTSLLDAPAPVAVARQRNEAVTIIDDELAASLGRRSLRILCNECVQTALRAGTLATADGQPVIWAYQSTRAAAPVVWVTAQLLLASARTDALDRADLLAALLEWAARQVRLPARPEAALAVNAAPTVDPALLRALVVAWSVQPDLPVEQVAGWLAARLFVAAAQADVAAAAVALADLGALDGGQPQPQRLAELANEWNLRAWIREARRR